MVVEVAETQENEAGDGTTTAVAITGELLKNAEDLLEQDIHPTAIIKGFNMAAEKAREEVDDFAIDHRQQRRRRAPAGRTDLDDRQGLQSSTKTSSHSSSSTLHRP